MATQIDTFNRTDSATLGANWTQSVLTTGIVGNHTQPYDTSFDPCRFNTALTSADMYTELSVLVCGGPGALGMHLVDARARMSASADTCYVARVGYSGGQSRELVRRVAGTDTMLQQSLASYTLPATVRIRCEGTNIQYLWNGAVLFEVTDTAIDGVTVGGLYGGLTSMTNEDGVHATFGPHIDSFTTSEINPPLAPTPVTFTKRIVIGG